MSNPWDVAARSSGLASVGLGSQPKITSINLHELKKVSPGALPFKSMIEPRDAKLEADFLKLLAASDQHEADLMNKIEELCRQSLKKLRADQSTKIAGDSGQLGVTHSGSAGIPQLKPEPGYDGNLPDVTFPTDYKSSELGNGLTPGLAEKNFNNFVRGSDPGFNPGKIGVETNDNGFGVEGVAVDSGDHGFHLDRNGNAHPRSTPMDGEKHGSYLPDVTFEKLSKVVLENVFLHGKQAEKNGLPGVNGLTKQQMQRALRAEAYSNIEKKAEELDQSYSYNKRVDMAAIEYRKASKNAGKKFLKKDALKQLVAELKDAEVKRQIRNN